MIVVKPNTKKIKEYINAGTDAFILCLEKYSSATKITFTEEEIKKIKETYPNIKIYVSIDKQIFNKEISNLKEILKKLDNMNLNGIMFYDLSIIRLKQILNLNIDLIYSPNFLLTNYKTCNLYLSLGVNSITISNCIMLNDIKRILEKVNVPCFINAFGYQVMSVSDRKLISNYLKEVKEKDNRKKHYMIEKTKKYEIVENNYCTFTLSDKIFDISNYLKDIEKYNPNLILDEISISHTKFIKILKLYTNKDNNITEKIKNIIDNTTIGFLKDNTIVKIKNKGAIWKK